MYLISEHKGNFSAAAIAAGKTPQAMRKLCGKASKKLGIAVSKKAARTQRLPTDQRGQVSVPGTHAEPDERE
jgi:hypothetical protein